MIYKPTPSDPNIKTFGMNEMRFGEYTKNSVVKTYVSPNVPIAVNENLAILDISIFIVILFRTK